MGKQVGLFVRQLREKKGLSQGDVAKLLQLKTAQSISNIERGVSPLPKAKIRKLAEILGVKKADIVSVVLSEVQDRYSKAAGVAARSIVVPNDLSADEYSVLKSLALRLAETKKSERATLLKQIKKLSS